MDKVWLLEHRIGHEFSLLGIFASREGAKSSANEHAVAQKYIRDGELLYWTDEEEESSVTIARRVGYFVSEEEVRN